MLGEKILIIGGGFGQLPAIKAAHELGLTVVVVDRNRSAPGMSLADVPLVIDIIDIRAVVTAAKKYNVCGVLTMQSDIGVPTVGAVVDSLKLTGSGQVVANRCSNKILTRKAFHKAGVPQPQFAIASTIEDIEQMAKKIGYPCILKAPDSSGSRGITKLNTKKDIPAAFEEARLYTNSNDLLVEEFIEGIEVGAQSFSVAGQCEIILVHDDQISPPPFMIPIAHSFPSSLNKVELEKTKVAIAKCLIALGISDGASNIDLIIDKKGVTKIIEVGARIGATCLPELVFYYTGIDWVKSAVQTAIGQKPLLYNNQTNQACAAFILEAPSGGILKKHSFPHEYNEHPDLLEWEITAKPGDLVSPLRKGTDRIGKVVTRGKSASSAIELACKICQMIEFDIHPSKSTPENKPK